MNQIISGLPSGVEPPFVGPNTDPDVEMPHSIKERDDDEADLARAEGNGMILREGEKRECICPEVCNVHPWGKEQGCISGN